MVAYDILENKNPGAYEQITTALAAAEKHIETVDTSIVQFLLDVDEEINKDVCSMRARAAAMAYLLLAVFDTPEEIINVIVNDERWQKWDNLEFFAKCYEGRPFPVITQYYGNIILDAKGVVKNPEGKTFIFPSDTLPIDYHTLCNDKPYQDKCGMVWGARDLIDLSQYQLDNYYVGVYKREDPDWGDEIHPAILRSACAIRKENDNGTVSIQSCKSVNKGMWLPLNKVDMKHSDKSWVETIISKEVIDKYNMLIMG